jgi:hypothetical protein
LDTRPSVEFLDKDRLRGPLQIIFARSTHASNRRGLAENSSGKGGAPLLIGNAGDNRKHVVESNQCRFVDPADGLAALFAGHGDNFIDHYL